MYGETKARANTQITPITFLASRVCSWGRSGYTTAMNLRGKPRQIDIESSVVNTSNFFETIFIFNVFHLVDGTANICHRSKFSAPEVTLDSRDTQKQGEAAYSLSQNMALTNIFATFYVNESSTRAIFRL